MTVKLPLPSDVDLSDMPYYPINDPRLKKSKSWRRAKHWHGDGPGLGFCLFNLWTAAFRCVPAGSLADDDDDLAEDAECDYRTWLAIKGEAMIGWELIDGRYWHRVVADIAWDLWQARLKKKHENAVDSHRASCRRAADKGLEPPPPPGCFNDWIAATYPETAAYMADNSPDVGATNANIPPTRDLSEAKVSSLTPCSPPRRAKSAEGQRWFAHELARLTNEIGPAVANALAVNMAEGQGLGTGQYRLVEAFKGAYRDRAGALVLPSKRRHETVALKWGTLLQVCAPELVMRHATVGEARERKVIAA